MVPSWLRGTWKRSYIRRVDEKSGLLGGPDSTVDVTYIQTPWAFVDIRRPPIIINDSKEVPIAFAGVTTVVNEIGKPPLVHWHSCLEMNSTDIDCVQRWSEAESGNPRPTDDQGYFENVSEDVGIPHAFKESDPRKTLEELWVRIDDGDGNFLSARKDKSLLVVAGNNFGYADQEKNIFVSGNISKGLGFVIEMSASDTSLEGTVLKLDKIGWNILPESTLAIDDIFDNYQ